MYKLILLFLVIVGPVIAQPGTVITITGKITGDVPPWHGSSITAIPSGTSTGGNKYSVKDTFRIQKVSWRWSGKITPSCLGFSFTPKDTVVSNMTQFSGPIYFKAKDTVIPKIKILSIDSTLKLNQKNTIVFTAWDNTAKLSVLRFDYSIDKGKTWDTIPCFLKRAIYSTILIGYKINERTDTIYFTPTVNSDYKMRAIVADYFKQADTLNFILKMDKTSGIKIKSINKIKKELSTMNIYNLLGKKVTRVNTPNLFIQKNSRRILLNSSRK